MQRRQLRLSGRPRAASPTVIVRNVSKSVLAGQRIGILGANGQGKSTVVKTIARDLASISGRSPKARA
jgi:ATP-binding cassette, subfamily F, member 3